MVDHRASARNELVESQVAPILRAPDKDLLTIGDTRLVPPRDHGWPRVRHVRLASIASQRLDDALCDERRQEVFVCFLEMGIDRELLLHTLAVLVALVERGE